MDFAIGAKVNAYGRRPHQWETRIGRKLKLRDLHILAVVAQCGSMAKAAAQLAMSQPAVSESIANLEAAVGVRLFDRVAKGVEPTRYTEALLKRGEIVFDELMQAVKEIEFLANPTSGEVRVASGDTGAAGLLVPAINRFTSRYPDVVMHVCEASAEPLAYPELRQRQVDVVLARVSKGFAHPELNVEVLFDDPARIAAGAKTAWAKRRKVALKELVGERWTLTSDQVIHDLVYEAFRAQGLEPPKVQVSASSMLLRSRLLATGRYLTVLPDSVLRANGGEWSVKALPVTLEARPMCVTLITLRNRSISPVVALFMDQLRSLTGSASSA